MTEFLWDFVGPRSELIARHHAKHLEEFLQREKVQGCEAGIAIESPVRAVAFLRAPDEAAERIQKALRPPRSVTREQPK